MRRPGLAKAYCSAFLHRGSVLSREAEMLLVRHASRLSEGEADDAEKRYFGSTMFQIPLDAVRACWRGELDVDALQCAVEGSVRLRIRFMRIAVADARHRAPDRTWGTFTTETNVRLVDDALHVDVDVESALDDALAEGHGA